MCKGEESSELHGDLSKGSNPGSLLQKNNEKNTINWLYSFWKQSIKNKRKFINEHIYIYK